jgi:hypothetical protein
MAHAWVRSSFSSGSGQCVEVRAAPGAVDVRDAKLPSAGMLNLPTPAWVVFVRGVTSR